MPAEDKMHKKRKIEASHFLEANELIARGATFTLEQIVEAMLCGYRPLESENEDITVEEDVVSFEDSRRVLSNVRKFMEQTIGKSDKKCKLMLARQRDAFYLLNEDTQADDSLEFLTDK
ncbi:hypothetical protein RF11_08924 [Thelohanellus kitauei]|uniref:Uncharacterized protein n=1 Tax=Thelohanellus kitauei TaxID=669202 RepID=A0A0C2M6U6_THEKT|nr:hypothetical protein RF11_08924 [Thelohanellus kitauei]